MSSDFAKIWYAMVFEGSEYKNNVKILVQNFWVKSFFQGLQLVFAVPCPSP